MTDLSPPSPEQQARASRPKAIDGSAARSVGLSKGEVRSEVSNQWFKRPADQRFLSLASLEASTRRRYDRAETLVIKNREIEFIAPEVRELADTHNLTMSIPDIDNLGGAREVMPTNWAFNQVASLAKSPAGYLRTLPSQIVAQNLTWCMHQNREVEQVKAYYHPDGDAELMAVTGPQYGRIPDFEVVQAIRQIAGNGTGDMPWKVPGKMEIGSGIYDPMYPVSPATTTLFASDRDLFIFLVDDTRPVEVGLLPNGEPDLMFRGFYVTQSEVGLKSLTIAAMYLRAVCCNRLLWGVEGFEELSIRHSKNAPARFVQEAQPALAAYAAGSEKTLLAGVYAAKAAKVAEDDEKAMSWLHDTMGLSKNRATNILAKIAEQEGHPARSAWDMAQGITAEAQTIANQDDRLVFERQAKVILDKAVAA